MMPLTRSEYDFAWYFYSIVRIQRPDVANDCMYKFEATTLSAGLAKMQASMAVIIHP